MFKVLLIRPRSSTNRATTPRIPLALLYMGSMLKANGYEVKVIDTNVESRYRDLISNRCKDAALVGITALTSEVKSGLEISKSIKERFNVPIVWGGIHPSLYPELTCSDFLVDYAVFGEGEYTLLELVKSLDAGEPLEGINGLVYKKNGLVKVNQPRPYANLEASPPIDYTLVDMNKYFEGGTWRKAVDVQTSRGCPYHCRFCVEDALGTHKVRAISAKRVVDECERLIVEYGANFITFVDDNFFLNRRRAKDICQEIISRRLNFKWFAEVRADYFRDGFIDREFLELAENSGLTNVTIGAESGVQRILDLARKDITVENIVKSAVTLSETDIIASYSFIIGFPTETKGDILTTLSLIEKLYKIYPQASYGIGILRAYPKSELTDTFVKQGWIKEPKSLQEFTEYKYNKVYTAQTLKPIWHCAPDFAYAVSCYSSVAYGVLTGTSIKKNLKYSSILLLPGVFLQKIARWRLEHQFFKVRIDMYVSRLLYYVYYLKCIRRFARWRIIKDTK